MSGSRITLDGWEVESGQFSRMEVRTEESRVWTKAFLSTERGLEAS